MGNRGFTLLETLVATAIMAIAFTAIIMVQSGSINATTRAKRINTVTLLARNVMIETEMLIEGKAFNEVKEEETGEFPEPFRDYKWKRMVKELEFPEIPTGSSGPGEEEQAGGGAENNALAQMLSRLMSQYLSKAVREVTVTITYADEPQEYSVTTYWVDLNSAFELQ